MKFIPEELFVGFKPQHKSDSIYLAYISSYIKGKASKKDSIDNWRDKHIPTKILKNELQEGFIIKEKAGDSGERKAWVRVLDPRGFEIEISIDNLLHILECEGCEKEKKIKGKCVYAFDETKLLLLPESSPVYVELKKHSEAMNKKNVVNDNIVPYEVYSNKSNEHLMYLGWLDTYTKYYLYNGKEYRKPEDAEKAYFNDFQYKNPYNASHVYEAYRLIQEEIHEKPEKHYWFFDGVSFRHTKTFPRYLVEHVTGAKDEFDMKKIERMLALSTELHRITKKEWKLHNFRHFYEKLKSCNLSYVFSKKYAESYHSYNECRGQLLRIIYENASNKYIVYYTTEGVNHHCFACDTIKQIYDSVKPEYCEITLDNDKRLRWFYEFDYISDEADLF